MIKHLRAILGVVKLRTTPYRPEGDGITERFNRTLISMLKTLDPVDKCKWKDHVAPLVHAYNCTRHESTGFTPFYLMFGRTPRLSIDVFLKIPSEYTASVEGIKQRLAAAYEASSKANKMASKHQASVYNQKAQGNPLQEGDLVLMRNVGLKGKQKLAKRWKKEHYKVICCPNLDIPVYKVARDGVKGYKILHRNMLLPLSLPREDNKVIVPIEQRVEWVVSVASSESFQTWTMKLSMMKWVQMMFSLSQS